LASDPELDELAFAGSALVSVFVSFVSFVSLAPSPEGSDVRLEDEPERLSVL
jgi:hypothetical protein